MTIKFKNVSKTYDNGTVALDNVNLEIKDGSFVFITGASGAGKSTLTKLLTREETVTSGVLTVDGNDISKMRDRRRAYYRRDIGIVFQDFRLIEDMTAYENIALTLKIAGEKRKNIDNRINDAIEVVNLTREQIMRLPSQLSGGEQQRVAIARAIVNCPTLLIADEPTGNIDRDMTYEVMKLFKCIHQQYNRTVIVVTHEDAVVRRFGGRVIRIANGTVAEDMIL